jgi:UDPglucose 6-dehydrogenase
LAEAADQVNEMTKDRLVQQALATVKPGDTVAVLGMAYRPDTYIVEESAGLHVAQALQRKGCRVVVHDYAATPKNSPSLLEFSRLADPKDLKKEKRVTAILICCPWPAYKTISLPKGTKVFDPWGVRE